MTQSKPPSSDLQFADANGEKPNYAKLALKIFRWTTYTVTVVTITLALHKAPPPLVTTSPEAAARAESKMEDVARSVDHGGAATLRLDETELNSFLASHLAIQGNAPLAPPAQGIPPSANSTGAAGPSPMTASAANPASPTTPALPAGTDAEQIEQMKSNVKDVKVELVGDHVRTYVVFDVHGKDMTLQLEGKLASDNGYLKFVPISGQLGGLSLPQSALETAVQHIMDSPENREKLKLPANMKDLKIENGEVVASY